MRRYIVEQLLYDYSIIRSQYTCANVLVHIKHTYVLEKLKHIIFNSILPMTFLLKLFINYIYIRIARFTFLLVYNTESEKLALATSEGRTVESTRRCAGSTATRDSCASSGYNEKNLHFSSIEPLHTVFSIDSQMTGYVWAPLVWLTSIFNYCKLIGD